MAKVKTSGIQVFLSLVMVFSIVIGFFGIAYVSNAYETENPRVLLFQSDSQTVFTDINFAESIEYSNDWSYKSSQQLHRASMYSQDNLTLIYSGNNTYISSISSISQGIAPPDIIQSNQVFVSIQLPNLDNWYVSNIILNSTSHGDIDGELQVRFGNYENPFPALPSNPSYQDNSGIVPISTDNIDGLDEFNLDIPLNLETTIRAYETSKEHSLHSLDFFIIDSDSDGMTGFILEFSVEIWGENVPAWSIQDSISAVLSGAIILNVMVGIYALDGVDMGKVKKILRKK